MGARIGGKTTSIPTTVYATDQEQHLPPSREVNGKLLKGWRQIGPQAWKYQGVNGTVLMEVDHKAEEKRRFQTMPDSVRAHHLLIMRSLRSVKGVEAEYKKLLAWDQEIRAPQQKHKYRHSSETARQPRSK
jgi:hypothetical protein